MKRLFVLTLLLITCAHISGCTTQPVTPVSTGDGTGINPAALSSVQSGSGTAIAVLSETKPNTTLFLAPGVIFVSFQTPGARHIEVSIGNVSGGYVTADSFMTKGSFNGSLAYNVPATDTYTLDIRSNGSWTAGVSTENPLATVPVSLNMTGSGTMVTPFFTLENGQYIFERSETGTASPQYYLRYANGNLLMDVNNTLAEPAFGVDSPATFQIVDVPVTGTYFMSTLTNDNPGAWHASILPVPPIPQREPGPLITQ